MKRSIALCGRSVVWTVLFLLLLTFLAAGSGWSVAKEEGATNEAEGQGATKEAEDNGATKEAEKKEAAEEEEAEKPWSFSLRGDILTGVRWLGGDFASSKFNEYREVPKGGYLQGLFLVGENPDARRFLELRAKNVRQLDELIQFRFGVYGRHQLRLRLDKTPHVFTNTGRLLFREMASGVFALPDQVQTDLQTIATTDTDPATPGVQIDTTAFGNIINGIVSPIDSNVQRRATTLTWLATPTPDLTYSLSFARENRGGSRPFGTTFVFTNQNELPEPVSYRTRDLRGAVEYQSRRGVAFLEIKRSKFANHVDALVWDNPIRLADHATLGAGRGQLALPPDNEAREISLSGAVHLSDLATFSGTLSRGKWTQNDAFLPFTVNSVLAGVPALPATSLNGKIDTALTDFNLHVAARPDLFVRAYHRRYKNDNKTPQLHFDGYVRTDASVVAGPFETEPVGFTQGNQGLEVAFSGMRNLSLKLSLDRETWHREHREVAKTRDNRLGLAADYRVNSWLTARGALRQSKRRIKGDYVGVAAQLPALRKFDEADRDRDEASFILQATPAEGRWDATLTFTRAHDDYIRSLYGLLDDRNRSITFDMGYALSHQTILYVGYARERLNARMNSRFRTFTGSPPMLVDIPENDWSTMMSDRVHTYWFGFHSVLVPDKWELDVTLGTSSATGRLLSAGVPGGDAAGEPPALPDTSYRWFEPSVTLWYHLGPTMSLVLGYRMERYRETDFAQDTMAPYMPPPVMVDAPTGTWLGARQPGYKAHLFTIALQRRF